MSVMYTKVGLFLIQTQVHPQLLWALSSRCEGPMSLRKCVFLTAVNDEGTRVKNVLNLDILV